MPEVQGELSTGSVSEPRYYVWLWQGRETAIAYDVRGSGLSLLLLPAFSSISTRAELDGLAQGLAAQYRVISLDWVGFGQSARPAWRSRPTIYQALLNDFVRHVVPEVAGVVACDHSAGYALGLAAQRTVSGLKAIALVAPTWRGRLPTAMGERRQIYTLLRWLVWLPLLGQGLYALNTHPAFLRWMMGRHVYSNADYITPDLMQAKRQTTQVNGARFASAAFVTGGLDPVQQRTDWLDLHDGHGHDGHDHHSHHLENDGFVSVSYRSDRPFALRQFEQFLETLPAEVFRAKGLLWFSESPNKHIFQLSGKRCTLDVEPWHSAIPGNQIVFIGRHLDADDLRQRLAACQAEMVTKF